MVIKDGYKQTEIGVIPNDWEIKSLGDLSQLITKGTTPKRFTDSGINYIKIESLKGDNISIEKCLFIDEITNITELKRSILNEGDILFAIAGATIGKCTIVPKEIIPANTNQALAIIRLKEKVNKKFVFYFLKSKLMQKYIVDNIAGGAQPNMNLAQVGRYYFPIPSTFTEQTAIATALSDADGLITGLEKLIAKKRNIKQGAMQQLLQPKEGWEVKKLGEVATIVRGASPRPIEDTRWFDNQSPIGWVRISDVTKSKKVLTETTQKLSDLGVKNSRLVENGNLIMSICATVGRPILTTFDVCIHDGFVVFRNPQIDKEYLYYFLTFIEDNWSKSGQTGSQMNLNTALINKTEIPFPKSNEEQTRIATIFSDMDAELSALEQKLEKYKKVKLGMMQELLTGKTRLV